MREGRCNGCKCSFGTSEPSQLLTANFYNHDCFVNIDDFGLGLAVEVQSLKQRPLAETLSNNSEFIKIQVVFNNDFNPNRLIIS